MKNIVNSYVKKFTEEHRKARRAVALLLALAMVVATGVSWQLHATGIALTNETYCGLEEHTHSEDCYESVLVCGLEESEGHTHTEDCYETEITLVCGLEESEGHTHTGDCYDEDGNLICGKEESEGHTHTDACYETETVLVCGQEESEGHTHTEDCYEEQLVCGKEEHTHTVDCLTDETADVETASDWEATLPDLTGIWAEDVVAVAESQLGYTESTANFTLADDGETRQGYTRYGAWYGNSYGDWDAMFASFCLYYAGVDEEDFPEASGAYAWSVELNKLGLYVDAADAAPIYGDLVFFDTDEDGKADHVGIVTEVNEKSGKLTVIEGDYAEDEDEADAVCENEYAMSDSTIAGYGVLPEIQETECEVSSEEDSEAETQEGTTAEETSEDAAELKQQTLTVKVDSATITVSGLLPEGAAATATTVEVENDELNIVMAFDISIYNPDGTVFEPEDDTISVTIQSDEISGDNEVYYISDAGDAEKMQSTSEDGTVTFDAEHFSTYALTVAADATKVASGDCSATDEDSVTWTLYSDGTIVIDGTGAMADYSTQSEQPWYDYMTKSSEYPITDIVIGAGVTHIGNRAFYGNTNLNLNVKIKSITFEEGSQLTSIGDYAFAPNNTGSKNTALESLELPEGLETIGDYAFYQYTALTDLTIPDSVTSIGNYAFYYCSSLTSLTFGADSQLTSIGSHAFYEADSLVNVTLPEELTSIGDNAFTNCDNLNSVELPDSLTSIGSSAFSGCTALNSITIPASVETIGSSAFYGCTALNSITIPASVTTLGSSAFYGCTGLRTVTFEEDSELTAINASTFRGCSSLTSINLPDSVTSIGSEAFYGCTALPSIDLPDGLTELGSYAFYNCIGLKEIVIPDGVTAIEDYTFYGCTNLATVTLPDGLTSIGAYAFYNDTALTGVTLPASVTSIGAYAFYHTDSLTDITIPDAVDSIGAYAFYLSGLTEVTFENTETKIDIGSYAFARSSELAKVNGETTLSSAMDLLGVTDNSVFYQTALTDMTTTVTKDDIVVTDTDEDDNEVTLTINQTKNSSGDVDYDYLTGEYAYTTVRLESKSADLDKETCRVYIQFDNDGGVIRAGDSSGSTATWTVGETKTFTTGDTSFTVTLYQVKGMEGFYYLEFGDLKAGATLEFTFVTYYTNGTEGGDALIYAEIENTEEASEDGTPANKAYDVQKITWTTEPETYTIKKTGSTASFVYSAGDKTVYLTGMYFEITTSKTSTNSSNGRDYVAVATFSDTLTLPADLSWRDGLVEAINTGNWYVNSSKEVHVIINGVDYVFCSFSGGMASNMSNIAMTVDNDGNIVMTWTVKQSSTSSDISTGKMTVTYGDEVIKFTGDTENLESKTYIIDNTIDAEYTFNYADETQTSDSSASTAATLNKGKLTLTKTSNTTEYYMGSAYTYTITAENNEALAYTGLQYIEDTLRDWLYLEPDEMESLLNDDKGLTITLNYATLYDVVSDTVTTTDSGSATIDQQMEGNDTVYYGEQGYYEDGSATGTLECSDTVKAEGVTIVFAWDNDDLKMTVTYSDTTETYTIGTGKNYTSISAALNGIGYFVTNDVTYTLLWDLDEDYVLEGNTTLTYSYTATVKDTFMRLEGDQYWDIDQKADTINSSKVSLGTQNLNTVTAYGEDYGSDSATALENADIQGTIYRDFSLYKGLNIYRDGADLGATASATNGDIIEYTVQVKHEGTASYSGLPLVDKMDVGQVLLVPVASNTQFADLGLATETVDDVEYYRLTTAGTYDNVTIYGSTVADKVVVSEDGSTLIYCYLNVSGDSTKTLHYLAVVDAEGDEEAGFSLTNRVWLNDHETHRLYAKTFREGKILTIEKQIVTSRGETPAEDDTTSRTILSEARTTVTYRLELENDNKIAVKITGDKIYDALPANASGHPWATDDITVTIVTDYADITETGTDLSNWQTNWSITHDDPSSEAIEAANTQCYLVWDDDLSLTFTGTVYFYVTLTYPTTEEAWDDFTKANLSTDLTNVLHVFKLESQVSHGIKVETKASLYKGVLETGLASSKDSSATYTATTDKDGLWYYTNDSAGRYGYVEYYVVLYNEGPVNLYLNTLEDVLPTGFTYDTYKTPTATTALTVTDSEEEELTCVNFTVTATYSSSTNKVSFDLSGGDLGYSTDYERYYLAPGQAAVFTYYVWTNAYSSTSSTEINTIAMPFYDYSGGGVKLSEEVSKDTVSWTTGYNRNDGEAELWNATKANGEGMTGTGDDWLASTVTVSRNQIKPGIEKTTSSDTAGSNETLTWSVKVTNDGESTMTGYYIYDVIDSDYFFTGTLTYTVYDLAGEGTTYTIGTLSWSDTNKKCQINGYSSASTSSTTTKTYALSADDWTTVYARAGSSVKNGKYTVFLKAWTDSDGNLVLCIRFPSTVSGSTNTAKTASENSIRAFSLPSGGYGVLSIKTTSSSSQSYNGLVTNTAYVQPTTDFDEGYIGNGTEILPEEDNEIVGENHAVVDEASIAVSFGYSTTSSKSVTEVSNGNATSNTATSTSKDASITVGSTSSTVRYTLTVGNGNEEMDELVLLDNLPEEGDTMTLTSADRKSKYTVLLANDPNFTVTVTPSGGTAVTLNEGTDYYIQYSTSGDVGEADLDTDSTTTNTWYDSLSEIPAGATVRSFRIVFLFPGDNGETYEAGDYIPANATVTVTFDATIDSDTVSAGETAYNSFGYRYSAANSDDHLSASPRKVGVQVPTAPTLVKKLVESDGTTEATAEEKTTFTFLIYQGDGKKDTVTGSTLDDLLVSLYTNNITTYTTVDVTVEEGKSVSESKLLSGLTQYTITQSGDSYSTTQSGTWTWTDETKYTIIEIPNADYDFVNWNTTTTANKYTFTYDSSEDITLTCVNKEQTWTLTLYKVDAADATKTLSGAVFALYSKTNTDYTYTGVDSELTVVEGENVVTWYLYNVQTTGDNGTATWSGLAKDEKYYLVEVKAPDGYNLTDTAQVVSQTNNVTAVTVTVKNTAGYELPSAGGDGIWLYTLTGLVLCCGAAVVLLRRKESE